jgi:hypothetical protein
MRAAAGGHLNDGSASSRSSDWLEPGGNGNGNDWHFEPTLGDFAPRQGRPLLAQDLPLGRQPAVHHSPLILQANINNRRWTQMNADPMDFLLRASAFLCGSKVLP